MAYLELPDGVPLYYEDRGSGPAVLLIHGWTMNSTFWGQNAGPLSETNRVITVDLRGHGLSGKTDEGHTLDQYARDVRDLLVHLGVRDVCMVGWSMGTAVILAYVRQFGCDLMRSAAFVDQSPRFLDGEDWDFPLMGGYSTTDLAVFTQGMRYARPSVVKPFIAACFAETPPAEVVDAVYAETTKTATSAALSVWYDMAYADLRPVLQSLSVPTLLMYGTRSKIFPGRLDDWLAEQLPQAQVARFDNSGHAPFSEEPDRFNEILNVFLRS